VVHQCLLVQLSWFPFFQYNTDWMGREIYHGVPKGSAGKMDAYNTGVRMGAIGLLLCSISLGVTSFLVPKLCRKLTSRVVWSISNLMVFAAMVALVVLGLISTKGYNNALTNNLYGPDKTMKGMALAIFALFGIPQAVCRCRLSSYLFVRPGYAVCSLELLLGRRYCLVSRGPSRLWLPPRRAVAKASPLASSTSPSSYRRYNTKIINNWSCFNFVTHLRSAVICSGC
jgi:hypothetical protein